MIRSMSEGGTWAEAVWLQKDWNLPLARRGDLKIAIFTIRQAPQRFRVFVRLEKAILIINRKSQVYVCS